ncbi:MAG: ATP-binding protein [Oscillospiraceae bacterium]|nr:ATP-binding protein [Oscillospiraceae bacterium]
MTKKIFQSILLVAGCVLLASLLIIMGFLYDYFGGVEENQLRDELSLAAAAVEDGGTDYLSQLTADRYRLTWIAADGSVLYDTKTDAESLENHASRAEVSQALATGTGESTRYSSTLMEKTMYYAQRLDDGTVLRISISRATVGMIAVGMIQPLLIVLIVALILSGLLARRLSRRIVDPLNSLDLEHPLDNDAYEELSPLLKRIHRQHVEIQTQLRELREKTDEFTQITGSMREGLVLLDEHGSILSINAAAQALFGADAQCVGRDFLTIERSHEISAAIQAAAADGHSEVRAERAGRVYQFDISRITSDGKFLGTVILAFDITEQEFAERNRREFTANVSHELKTPLQGIIGSAELIENGMVRPDDLPRFVGHIHAEAARLVTLIDDIIRLSQLDEGDAMPTEPVDLLAVSQEAAENLHDAAAARNVTVSVTGQPAVLPGVRRLIYEIVYNLCDNAIKYNRDGGRVDVTVAADAGGSSITVADTGIGIAPEHQARVFERFYRVDKSHSKASGGTGLGLSIVKHAVQYHHGRIELESTPGTGTTIRVVFPNP